MDFEALLPWIKFLFRTIPSCLDLSNRHSQLLWHLRIQEEELFLAFLDWRLHVKGFFNRRRNRVETSPEEIREAHYQVKVSFNIFMVNAKISYTTYGAH